MHPESTSPARRAECPFHFAASGPAEGARRAATLAYGLLAYSVFFVAFCYAVGFVGNWLVPKSIDSGRAGPLAQSMLVNAGLLSIFVLQHTIMARPAFKRAWTKVIPAAIERSTYVLAASVSLLVIFFLWRPMPRVIWDVESPVFAALLSAVSLGGWGMVFLTSFVINHFDLFGLRQVWARFRARAFVPVGFRLAGPYKLVRHPLMVGFLIAFWATPQMTVGHLFFCVMTTGYILLGTWFEERDLIAEHGERYLEYRRQVRGLLPLPRSARASRAHAASPRTEAA
jgi:protein-S-isoprenylcysteine O-methyltransferase Ste14